MTTRESASVPVSEAGVAAEQAQGDALYRKVMSSAAVGMCVTTPEGTFEVVNDALCEFFGYDANAMCTKTWQELTAPEYLQADLTKVEAMLAGHLDSYRTTKQFIYADGHRIWGDLSVSCLRGPGGEVQKFIAQIVDVTAGVTAQQELARYRQLIETSNVGTALSNLDGSMAMVNQAMCDLAGVDMATALQMTWTQVMPEPHLQALLGAVEDLLAGRIAGYRGKHAFIHADGNLRWIDMSLSVMRTPDGQPEYIIFQSVDISAEVQAREHLEAAQRLLAASADSMLDPQVLLEAVRDCDGRVIDFVYRSVNPAACSYLGLDEDELVGQPQLKNLPNLKGSGLQQRYIQCLADGEPVVLTDFSYFNEIIDDDRRYDIRATRAGPDLLSLSWTDVTERFTAVQRIAASEKQYRLLAENAADIVCHVRDGHVVWVSPSIEAQLGAPPEYWLGQSVFAYVPPEDLAEQAALMAAAVGGGEIKHRVRMIGLDGVVHWLDLHAKPFIGPEGRQDGVTASLRLVDDQVAAEKEAEEARQRQARTDALYRRSMDSAAVGTCLADLEGNFVEVNTALCEFFGYDADTLRQMTWQELTDPDYLQADLDSRAQVLAGDIESYRMVKRFIHADGHPVWGDLAVSCIRDADGQVELFIGQIADITAEVQAREQLEQARREQKKLDERYRRSMNNAAVGMGLVSPEGRTEEVNDAMCQFFGLDAQTLKETPWQDVTAPEYLETEQRNLDAILEGRIDSYRMTKHFIRGDGRSIWGDLSVSAVRDDNGRVENFITLMADVTAEVEARQELAEQNERNRLLAEQLARRNEQIAASERRFRLLADNAVDVVIHCRGTQVVWASPSIEAALGVPVQRFTGSDFNTVVHPDDLDTVATSLQRVRPGQSLLQRFRIRAADGDDHWVDSHIRAYLDTEGNADGLILSLRIVDAQVRAEQQLDRLARFDALTGLVNRAETLARLESALTCARTPGTELGVLFCDIDRFKTINDTMGHNVGDAVIRTVADRISQSVRHGDTVGRTGGDEIMVLLPGLHSLDEAIDIAEKIRARAAHPIHDNGNTIQATLSLGATLAVPGESITDLTARADTAMYQAKHAGGNTVSGISVGSG